MAPILVGMLVSHIVCNETYRNIVYLVEHCNGKQHGFQCLNCTTSISNNVIWPSDNGLHRCWDNWSNIVCALTM